MCPVNLPGNPGRIDNQISKSGSRLPGSRACIGGSELKLSGKYQIKHPGLVPLEVRHERSEREKQAREATAVRQLRQRQEEAVAEAARQAQALMGVAMQEEWDRLQPSDFNKYTL